MSTIAIDAGASVTERNKISGDHFVNRQERREPVATTPERKGPRVPKRLKLMLFATLALGGVATGGWKLWDYQRTWVTTDNAYVQGHVHQVSSRIAGTVGQVLVLENEQVVAGQPLLRLDPRDWETKRDQARAAIQQADAQIAQADAQIIQAEADRKRIAAQVTQVRAQSSREEATVTKARADFARAKNLFYDRGGVISRAEFDTAKAGQETATASLQAAQSAITSAQAQVAAVDASVQAAKATREVAVARKASAAAEVRDAELQLSYTTVVAPISGRIGRKNVEDGNRVQPGQALLAIVQDETWVVANFKETQLAHVVPGQEVEVEVDAIPGHEFHGKVDSVSPASGAQFALLPPDNATGNFTKVVQRIPVKIVFPANELGPYAGRIVPGMSVNAKVRIHG